MYLSELMMSQVNLELVARQIHLNLLNNLPATLTQVSTEMQAHDTDYYGQLGVAVPSITLSPPATYSVGHDPLVLERPLDEFPLIGIMVFHQLSLGGGDNYERLSNDSYIEAFVVSEDESKLNSIAWRYARAIHRVLMTYSPLDENIEVLDTEPEVDVSNIFTRRKSSVDNTTLFIQGVRFDFTVNQSQPVTDTQIW